MINHQSSIIHLHLSSFQDSEQSFCKCLLTDAIALRGAGGGGGRSEEGEWRVGEGELPGQVGGDPAESLDTQGQGM
eukprot:scaffold21138_cov27-Tisochrysis_lutea.AAC.1